MNYLLLLNAAVLCILGVAVHYRRKERLSMILLIANLGLAVWNVCVFITKEHLAVDSVDLVEKIKFVGVLTWVSGTFYFCRSYPYTRKSRFDYFNLLFFFSLSLVLLSTDYVTHAAVVDGEVVFTDNPVGFPIYTLYLLALGIGAVYYLYKSYREFPDYANNIKYISLTLFLFGFFGVGCNLILPIFGYYGLLDLGRASSMFPALFFAYIITKHDFMDMEVIINKYTAWAVTACIVVFSFILIYHLLGGEDILTFVAYSIAGLFWAGMASRLQNFLLTTARHKFVRGWYDTEDVISGLAGKITSEKNRESIFSTLESMLDDVFQMQKSQTIVSIRDQSGMPSGYLVVRKEGRNTWKNKLNMKFALDAFQEKTQPLYLDDVEPGLREELLRSGFRLHHMTVLIPFHSPEQIEGLIILGEKSIQESYSERDMRFFSRLVNYMAAILYRLTPMEKLEQLYLESRQKLHEAEIQLLRAQKIESIVHATRQCHHEIRTPLNIIQLGIGRIKTLEDLENYRRIAGEEIARALEIVEETLTITDVNKPSADRFSHVDVNEVLQRVSRLVDPGRYNLIIEANARATVWGVFSDIQVALTNLVHNAMEAMPDGGMLRLSARDAHDSVIIEVEDSGVGIAKELRSRVWEPYFSGHETEVGNSTAGRGWGLTIVNRIVTENKGTVNFTSEPGMGTRFTIILSAAQGSSAQTIHELPSRGRRDA